MENIAGIDKKKKKKKKKNKKKKTNQKLRTGNPGWKSQ